MNAMFQRLRSVASNNMWIILVALGAAVAFFAAQPLTVRYLAAQQLRITPYTLRLESYDYQFGPEGRRYATQIISRRSDGALVDSAVSGILAGSEGLDMRKVSLPNGQIVSVADRIAGYVQWPSQTSDQMAIAKERLRHPPENCMLLPSETVVERTTVLGHEVVVLARPSFGNERVRFWRAPDLACETLRFRVEDLLPNGAYKLKAETKAVSLVLGDPDPALFAIPANYAGMKPSELMHREFDRAGAAWDENIQRGADKADAQYSAKPAPAPASAP